MPFRAYNLLFGLIGAVLVVLLLLSRANLLSQGRTGPTWKRRLISAGLMVLGALGFSSIGGQSGCTRKGTPVADVKNVTTATAPDTGDRRDARTGASESGTDSAAAASTQSPWQLIKNAWRTMAPLAADSPGSTGKQREEAVDRMKLALAAIDALVKSGGMDETEARLLKADAARLQTDMFRAPPSDFKGTCYRSARFLPAKDSLERINKRLPLLRRLVTSGKLRPEVLARLLPTVERDLQVLSSERELKKLAPNQRTRAVAAAQRTQQAIAQIKEQLLKQGKPQQAK